ncbi:hypothetical protein BT93_H0887 [Corymbia citriodora subsp. variegata]|nr:hypothetical protein BT93_H0887 [Corymbia citriodora subsp. variegata]
MTVSRAESDKLPAIPVGFVGSAEVFTTCNTVQLNILGHHAYLVWTSYRRISSSKASIQKHLANLSSGQGNLRVSINLPDNEISLLRSRRNLSFSESSAAAEPATPPSPSPHSSSSASASIGQIFKGKAPAAARGELREWLARRPAGLRENEDGGGGAAGAGRGHSGAAGREGEEEREMKPLSELAAALGMSHAYADS